MTDLREVTAWKGIFGPNSRRVFAYLRPQRRKLWIIAVLGVLYVPLSLVEPYLLLYLVDRVLLGGHPELLVPFFIRLLPLFLLATCVDFLLNYTLLLIARDLHHEVKSEQLDNLLAKGTSFFRNTASGKLLFSFFNDSNQIGALLSFGVINSVLNFFFVAARLLILWYLDPVLLLAYLSIVPFQVAVIYKVMKVAMRLEIDLKGKDEELTARIESLLRGALTVKAFSFGAPMAGIWKRRFASRLNLDLRNMMWKQLGSLTITNIQAVGVFAVLFIGAWKIDAGALTLGALLAFVAVSGRVTPSLQALIAFLVGIQESLVNIERYYRIYDLPDEEAELRTPRVRAGLNGQVALCPEDLGEIRAKHVLVDHGNGARVRVPCDFTMKRGESYLWYGPNGVGKTSLGLALAGLIPHEPGTILCGGSALSDFSLHSIRQNILYVGSEPFWPERTLRENFANDGAVAVLDQARLEEVLYVSTADQVLSCLPKGMDTTLSSDGHILSRGENQRLFLAMVLYRLPAVLVLDESLSNVSDRLLRQIFERLREYRRDCLRIHVSHRLDHQDLLDNWVAFNPFG